MKEKKVAILSCTGIGQVVGTISRQVAYRICDDIYPHRTILVCLPALVKGVQEDIDMIRDYPVVVIEGCKECCATYALSIHHGEVKATISIPNVLKGNGLKVKR